MKKIISFILVLSALLAMVSCEKAAKPEDESDEPVTTVSNTSEPEDTESPASSESEETEPEEVYFFGLGGTNYLAYFVNFFHDTYKKGDDISDINLLWLAIRLIECNNSDYDIVYFDQGVRSIKGEDIRKTVKMIVGYDVDITQYHDSLKDISAFYCSTNDTYFGFDFSSYFDDEKYNYGILRSIYDENYQTTFDIKETDKQTIITADIYHYTGLGKVDNVREMQFIFNNVYTYGLEIQEIKVLKTKDFYPMSKFKSVEFMPDRFKDPNVPLYEENRKIIISLEIPEAWEKINGRDDNIIRPEEYVRYAECDAISTLTFSSRNYRVDKDFVMNKDTYFKLTGRETARYFRTGKTKSGLDYIIYEGKLVTEGGEDDWISAVIYIRLNDRYILNCSYFYFAYDYRVMNSIIDSISMYTK